MIAFFKALIFADIIGIILFVILAEIPKAPKRKRGVNPPSFPATKRKQ